MKRIFPILVVGMLGPLTAAAQSSASVQSGASAQSQTSVQTSKSGTQASSSGSASSSASANAGKNSADISEGTKIDATLASTLDAKKNKPGDRVEARTTQDIKEDGKVVLKKGTHLVGHVTQAKARASGQSQSQLGIVFDHAVLSNGQEVPFNATIQALAVAQSSAATDTGADRHDHFQRRNGRSIRNGARWKRVGGRSHLNCWAQRAGSVVNTASSLPVNAGGTLNTTTRSTGADWRIDLRRASYFKQQWRLWTAWTLD